MDAAARGRPAGHREPQRAGPRERELSWPELRRQVAALALHLQRAGRAAAATASRPTCPTCRRPWSRSSPWPASAASGASARPTWAPHAVLDRFRQIEPKVLIACDGVHLRRPRRSTARAVVAELRAALPSVQHVLVLPTARRWHARDRCAAPTSRDGAVARTTTPRPRPSSPLWLPFDHPLWIVYSSGTTGLPKPIVHGHGGIVLVALTLNGAAQRHRLQLRRQQLRRALPLVQLHRLGDVERAGRRPAQRHHLLHLRRQPGGTQGRARLDACCGASRRDLGVTFFGAGAAFFANCMKAGVELLALRRPVARARAGHHRLAAVRGGAALGHAQFAGHGRTRPGCCHTDRCGARRLAPAPPTPPGTPAPDRL